MIKFICRHNKDYSRFNIIKELTKDIKTDRDVYILLPFSKNQFFKNIFKRDRLINDFFISNYDTYVHDRKKITKRNPRAWWKYFQDWVNFRFSKFILSDTQEHFNYWEKLFGKYHGQHYVLPVLADKSIYFPPIKDEKNKVIKILFYGSFIPLHGINVILKAFAIMEQKNIQFEATIIGNGQKYSEMKKLFNKLKLKNVVMDGDILPEKDLAETIRSNDIILGIFGSSKKAKSVIPNKVYQSTACKKCTVTMESKTLHEFYSETDLVTCKNSADDLSDALIDLVSDRNKIKAVSENGYNKFLENYNNASINFKEFIKTI